MGGTLPEEGGKFVSISLQNTQDHMLHYARHNRLHHASIDHVARQSFWAGYRLLKVTGQSPRYPTILRMFISLGKGPTCYICPQVEYSGIFQINVFFRGSLNVNSGKRSCKEILCFALEEPLRTVRTFVWQILMILNFKQSCWGQKALIIEENYDLG